MFLDLRWLLGQESRLRLLSVLVICPCALGLRLFPTAIMVGTRSENEFFLRVGKRWKKPTTWIWLFSTKQARWNSCGHRCGHCRFTDAEASFAYSCQPWSGIRAHVSWWLAIVVKAKTRAAVRWSDELQEAIPGFGIKGHVGWKRSSNVIWKWMREMRSSCQWGRWTKKQTISPNRKNTALYQLQRCGAKACCSGYC